MPNGPECRHELKEKKQRWMVIISSSSDDHIEVLVSDSENEENNPFSPTKVNPCDESLLVMKSKTSNRCPITGLPMKNPVKNKHCGHRYEKSGARQHIKNQKKKDMKPICPVPGCPNTRKLRYKDLARVEPESETESENEIAADFVEEEAASITEQCSTMSISSF